MAVYEGSAADLTSSSEMSSEVDGVGMGRRVGPSARTLGDFLPRQLSDSTSRKKWGEGKEEKKEEGKEEKKEEGKGGKKEKKEEVEEISTGPIWTSVIHNPVSAAVILGSWSNLFPYFGLVTRFRSFEDPSDPVVRNLKFCGCNKLVTVVRNLKFCGCNNLVSLNEETFAASFYSGSIVLWDFDLTDDSRVTFFRHHGKVSGLEASHDKKYLLSCGQDRKVSIIDVAAGVLKDEIREGHFDGIHDLSPSPCDNNCFLTCGYDGIVSLWDWRVNEGRREVAETELNRTPTSIHWSRVDPNLFYVGTCTGSLASFDVRNISFDHMARDVSPAHCVNRIKPIERDRIAIVSQTNCFQILKERSLITTFSSSPSQGISSSSSPSQGISSSSSPSQGIVQDVVQVDESTIYSISTVPGFTRHNLVNSNNQTQTETSEDEKQDSD